MELGRRTTSQTRRPHVVENTPQKSVWCSKNLQFVDENLGADVNVGDSGDTCHRILVVPAAEILFLEDLAVVGPFVEAPGSRPVEQPVRKEKEINTRTRIHAAFP